MTWSTQSINSKRYANLTIKWFLINENIMSKLLVKMKIENIGRFNYTSLRKKRANSSVNSIGHTNRVKNKELKIDLMKFWEKFILKQCASQISWELSLIDLNSIFITSTSYLTRQNQLWMKDYSWLSSIIADRHLCNFQGKNTYREVKFKEN